MSLVLVASLALALAPTGPTRATADAVAPYHWRNVAILGGGFVTGVIPHPTAKDVRYARTDIGGAYRWNPSSQAWVPLQDWIKGGEWNLYGVESVALDPTDPNRLYLAAGTYTNDWAGNGAILSSKDQGRTWHRVDVPFKLGGNMQGRSMGERLVVNPDRPSHLLLGTRNNGLWESNDAARSWTTVPGFPAPPPGDHLGVVWASFGPKGSGGSESTRALIVARAVKNGPTLFQANANRTEWAPLPGQPIGLYPHQAKWDHRGRMVVVYGDHEGPNNVSNGAVWRYTPRTRQWVDLTPERPGPGNTFGYGGVALDPRQPGVILVSTLCRWSRGDTVFQSVNDGRTWRSLKETARMVVDDVPFLRHGEPEANFGHWIGDVEIDPNDPTRAWYVTGATIYSTRQLTRAPGERMDWFPDVKGLEETAVLDLESPTEGAPLLSALGDIGGFVHHDLTRSPSPGIWKNPILNTTSDLDWATRQPRTLVRVGSVFGTVPVHGSISRDAGVTWTPFSQDPPGSRGAGTIAITADARRIVWAASQASPAWTEDDGKTWTPVQGLPVGARVLADRVAANQMVGFDGSRFYASTDGGRTFERQAMSFPEKSGRPAVVFGRAGHVWMPTPEGLYRSVDGARTWRRVGAAWSVGGVGFGKSAPGTTYPTLYAHGKRGEVDGFFRSTDEGENWTVISDANTRFGTRNVITGDPRVFGRVYVGTNGRGILVADPR